MVSHPSTLGVILAGGLSRRMGGVEKTLLRLQGRTLLEHVAHRLAPQCESLILNANGNASRFDETSLPVVPDSVPDYPGPLAGILAAMEWAASNKPFVEWIVSTPSDTPFIPLDLVDRLHAARNNSRSAVACAASGSQPHYTTALWPISLRDHLRQALVSEDIRRVEDWVKRHDLAMASWPNEPSDPFFNINTPDDLRAATMLSNALLGSKRLAQDAPGEQEFAMVELDLSGLKCPLPVLRTRKALLSMKPGDQLHVICTDPLAGIDIPNLVRELGDTLLEQQRNETGISFLILREEHPA